MTLEELAAYLRDLKKASAQAVVPAVNAMAFGFQDRVKSVTLRRTSHGPGEFWRATQGQPPAYASGTLAGSVLATPALAPRTGASYAYANASVGAYAKYASIQEYGGFTWPSRYKFMKWTNTGGTWYKKLVEIPEHPYFAPTVDSMIRDGSFSRLAASAFYRDIARFYGP